MPKKTPKINQLLDNAVYVGKVSTKRTVYYVFQTEKDYLLFSFKDATYMSGNFNVVMADTVDRIYTAFRGKKRITRGEIEIHPQMKKFVTGFEALQTLYVLVARKQASIDRRSLNKSMLFFNLRK
jgi:hypothetical protein